jgi:ribosome-associated protein
MELSRTEQKRRVKELEVLVAELVSMPPHVLRQVPCAGELIEHMLEAGKLQGGARKRLIKYVTKMLRQGAVDELYAFVSARRGKALVAKKQFHELEYLRNALIDEALHQHKVCEAQFEPFDEDWPSLVIESIGQQLPTADTAALKRLAHLFARTRNPRHSREIFRQLRAAQEQMG